MGGRDCSLQTSGREGWMLKKGWELEGCAKASEV